MIYRIECIITGRVQMVMFRDFAQRKGRSFGIVGTVQNLKNGSVFVVAEGEKSKLEQYVELLKKGSLLSRVDTVEVKNSQATNEFKKFSILY